MRNVIFYFHGWNSAPDPNSSKVQILEEWCDDNGWELIAINCDYKYPRFNITKVFQEILHSDPPIDGIACAGTSLGAWQALQAAGELEEQRLVDICPVFLFNPSLDPYVSLKEYIGINKNYVTGVEWEFTEYDLRNYDVDQLIPERIDYFFDDGDEVISPNETIDFMFQNSDFYLDVDYTINRFAGGSHRFEHMREALPIIQKTLEDVYG